jgi:hypothetical protein
MIDNAKIYHKIITIYLIFDKLFFYDSLFIFNNLINKIYNIFIEIYIHYIYESFHLF